MVNENIKLIAENKKPVETVYELKNEVPSFEEFMKTHEEDKGIVDSYENEFDSYGDIRVKGTYYGPGFWDDFVKPVASGVLIAASWFPPTAPVAMPISLTVAGIGATTMGIGHVTGNEKLKEVGKDIGQIAVGGIQEAAQ